MNGAGKTTTIKILCGILHPTSGKVIVNGYIPYLHRKKYVREIGVVFGNISQLNPSISVYENFVLLSAIFEIDNNTFTKTLSQFSALLNLDSVLHKSVRQLSLGERVKCNIAAAMIHKPKVLFLDEPTIGVDIISTDNIRSFIQEIVDTDKVTVVLTTHDMQNIEALANDLLIIDKGNKIFNGPLRTFMSNYKEKKRVKITFRNKTPLIDVANRVVLQEVKSTQLNPFTIQLDAPIERPDRLFQILGEIGVFFEIQDIVSEDFNLKNILKSLYAGELCLK